MSAITTDDLISLAYEAQRYAAENAAPYLDGLTPEQQEELLRVYSSRAYTAGLLVMIALASEAGVQIACAVSSILRLGIEDDIRMAVRLAELPANAPVLH